MDDPLEEVEFVVRSPHRVAILEATGERPMTVRELGDRIDASRRTVKRAVAALCERGWLTETEEGYARTRLGTALAADLRSLLETAARLAELRPFFRHLDAPDFEFGPEILRDADVITATPQTPYAPVERIRDSFTKGETIRTLAPVTSPLYTEPFCERVTDDDVVARTVLPRDVLDAARSREADTFEEILATGRVEVYAYDGDVPFGLLLLEDRALVGAHDEQGGLRAVLETTAPEVTAWAEETFERYRAQSALSE